MKIHDIRLLVCTKACSAVKTIWKLIKLFISFISTIPCRLNSLRKKAIGLFRQWKHNTQTFIKWFVNAFRNRYSIPFDCFFRAIKTGILSIVILGSFLYLLISSEVVILSESGIPYLNQQFTTTYIAQSGVLGSQITFVLICVSLIALISNIDQKYIYGEKLIHLAFPKYGLFSFGPLMILLFSLLILNVIQMLQKKPFAIVIIVYLITMYMALIILYRFSMIFLNQYAVKKKLLCRYYRSNLTHMQKDKPLVHHTPIHLVNLKSLTHKHIDENNIAALNDNMLLYFSLLKYTLHNHSREAQEYHTEMHSSGDIISHIHELALSMLNRGNALNGIRTYVALLQKLNFYKVTTSTDMLLSGTGGYFIEALTSFNNKSQLKRYLNLILEMNTELIEQVSIFSTADFCYCRLSKPQFIHSFVMADMYARTYDQLQKITYLSPEDQDELTNDIRMSIISLYTTGPLQVNIDNFRTWHQQRISKRTYQLDIRSEPVAHYLLRLIENSDVEHLWDFRFLFRQTPNKDSDEVYGKILSILSVLNMLYHENKRVYAAELNIDETATKQLFKKLKYLDCPLSSDQAKRYHDFTIQHYIRDKLTSRDIPGENYPFSRYFVFDKVVVDTVFACLIWESNPGNRLDTITSQFNLQFDEKTYYIMKELGFSLPEAT